MTTQIRTVLLTILGMILALGASATHSVASDRQEQLVVAKQDRRLYVNTRTLTSPGVGVVSLWDKVVPRPGSRYHRQIQRTVRNSGRPYRDLAYFQTLTEIDCIRNIHRDVTTVYYDRFDRILLSAAAEDARWHEIREDQKETLLRDKVCPGQTPVEFLHQVASVSMGCPEIH